MPLLRAGQGSRAFERRGDTPTYVVLGNWTDQGIRNVKETPKRENAFHELCEKFDARVKDVYRTMGRYDIVAIVDARTTWP